MAKIPVLNNPELVTLNDLNENEIDFADDVVGLGGSLSSGILPSQECTAFIEVTSGTVKFNVNKNAGDSGATYTAGDKLALSFVNNLKNIRVKATIQPATFKITV